MTQEFMVASSIYFLALFGMPRNARCCLHCEKEFTNKFNYYRKHLWWRSTWAGDLMYCQKFIDSWMNEIKETKVAMPKEDLKTIAQEVYSLMDQQYKLSHTGIGYFPKALQRIKRYEVEKVTEAIKKSAQVCSEHCGIYRVDYIDCTNCETKPVECGHNCSVYERSIQESGNNVIETVLESDVKKTRGMLHAGVNVTSTEKSHSPSEMTPVIILPLLAAIVLLLGILMGLHYCFKSRKNKHLKGQAEVSSSEERNSIQKKSSKRKHLKKWKRQKRRRKQETDYSTE